MPPARDWPINTTVSGYWFLNEEVGWQPSPDLLNFLSSGKSPLYIGFGSMSNRNPQATLALIQEAVSQTDQRAIIAAGWSGARAVNLPKNIYLIDRAPHSWLFQQVAGVIHDGGAGTTGAGLRAGKPTMIIPHMSDQPYWGRRVYELGVGIKPVPRYKLTSAALAAGICELTNNAAMKAAAQTLGDQIRAEEGVTLAVKAIELIVRQ